MPLFVVIGIESRPSKLFFILHLYKHNKSLLGLERYLLLILLLLIVSKLIQEKLHDVKVKGESTKGKEDNSSHNESNIQNSKNPNHWKC